MGWKVVELGDVPKTEMVGGGVYVLTAYRDAGPTVTVTAESEYGFAHGEAYVFTVPMEDPDMSMTDAVELALAEYDLGTSWFWSVLSGNECRGEFAHVSNWKVRTFSR